MDEDNVKTAMDELAMGIADKVVNGEPIPMEMSLALQALALYRLDDEGIAVVFEEDHDDEDEYEEDEDEYEEDE